MQKHLKFWTQTVIFSLFILTISSIPSATEEIIDRNEMVPCLAVSRKWIDDTTMEIKLREGVRFSNGEPFDAHAVKFNFDYQRKHLPGQAIEIYLRNVNEIQVVDRNTLRMMLDQPDALLMNRIWMLLIGAPKYMEQVGWDGFWNQPIGTGPYVVEGVSKDYRKVAEGEVYVTLVANPDYWNRGHPKIGKITFVQYSPKEALRAVIEGRVDLVTSLIPKDTLKVAKSPYSKVIKGRKDVRYTLGFLNMMSPHTLPLRKIRVREALNYAVNKKELFRYAFKANAVEMRGVLTEKSGVDLSDTKPYDWNVPKARELLKEAGYGEGFKMKLYYTEKDYLIAHLLRRFYSLLKVEVEIIPVSWEWIVRHVVYPNTREGYSWKNEDWWLIIHSDPGYVPEVMGGLFEWSFNFGAPWQTYPDWLIEPLDMMYHDLLRTKDRDKRFQIYKKANEYIADRALWVFTMAPLTLYGVNEEFEFIPQVSQYLYLDYSSVTDKHWSVRAEKN
ncbi:MAG: ABC transporter substrate-binding protein [Deltaproteobacteria bacterium]|nr:ABC transporter substrate-binding protein [Deltaproteobacteria bacterium]